MHRYVKHKHYTLKKQNIVIRFQNYFENRKAIIDYTIYAANMKGRGYVWFISNVKVFAGA